MAQLFPRWTNVVSKFMVFGIVLLAVVTVWACLVYARSSFGTGSRVMHVQPVPFSHQHHSGQLGIDCRYCHTTVETEAFAGIPSTETCMNCHSQIWAGSDTLRPVWESYRENRPLHWERVHNVPGFVYFDHSIHVQKGVGCSTCHGAVDRMPFTYQASSLLMEWCLDCHRNPEQELRPVAEVFNMAYIKPPNQDEVGRRLVAEYSVRDPGQLTSCSVCHR